MFFVCASTWEKNWDFAILNLSCRFLLALLLRLFFMVDLQVL